MPYVPANHGTVLEHMADRDDISAWESLRCRLAIRHTCLALIAFSPKRPVTESNRRLKPGPAGSRAGSRFRRVAAIHAVGSAIHAEGMDAELNRLPAYARGFLQIRVPVQVTLASQRKSIQEIIELGPGSIIKFDKTCDEPLELCVGDRPIAEGEVVKVGDKFGLKISGLVK